MGELTVDVVGERVGYRDLSTFRRLFKRETGLSVVRADGGKFEDVAPRVWVFPTEVPDGQWGGRGVIPRLADIHEMLASGENDRKVGQDDRKVTEERLGSNGGPRRFRCWRGRLTPPERARLPISSRHSAVHASEEKSGRVPIRRPRKDRCGDAVRVRVQGEADQLF
jgi:hypothetical protein